MQEKGWKSTIAQIASTADLASNSRAAGEDSPLVAPAKESAEEKDNTKTASKDQDYFNTILAGESAHGEDGFDGWKNFFGTMGSSGYPSADPIVEIASALFAGLMAMAIQIDNMGNAEAVQQTVYQSPSVSQANALASQNFEAAMDTMNSNPIKRTRS